MIAGQKQTAGNGRRESRDPIEHRFARQWLERQSLTLLAAVDFLELATGGFVGRDEHRAFLVVSDAFTGQRFDLSDEAGIEVAARGAQLEERPELDHLALGRDHSRRGAASLAPWPLAIDDHDLQMLLCQAEGDRAT